MLDIKLLREDKEKVIENLKRRGDFDTKIIDKILNSDTLWREAKGELDSLKAQKNKESKAIAEIKKQGGDIKKQLDKVKEVAEKIQKQESKVEELLRTRNEEVRKVPNLLDKEVPKGEDDEDNVELRQWGKKPKFNFKPRNHQELCELNDWFELERAAKNSGARFYFMKNELLMLENALHNFVLNKLIKKGFNVMSTPPMLRAEVAKLAIPLADFEDTVYTIGNEGDELFLIGTSEHALSTFHKDEIINHKDLPKMYAGFSPCFRREAGVTKDEKGLFRVHNFNKVEQFIYCAEEDSEKYHKFITEIIEEVFQELELHYRVVDICTGDIGMFATRKYDLEAWLPGQDKYREMGSSSNYRDYGARSLNVRYQAKDNSINFCHTLNNTAIATPRAVIAVIEQHQTKEGNVIIPKVLRPFFGGREFLKEN